MRVLVTGIADSLGDYVVDRLEQRGHTVLDAVATGRRPDSSTTGESDVLVVLHDTGAVSDDPPDVMRELNLAQPLALLNDLEEGQRAIVLSSVQVYAPAPSPAQWPLSETAPRRAHGSARARRYGQQKIELEDSVLSRAGRQRFEYAILRSTLRYGTGAGLPESIVEGLAARPRRTATQYESLGVMQWAFVEDVAEAVVLAADSPVVSSEALTVAGAEPVTSWDLMDVVNRVNSRGARWHEGWFSAETPGGGSSGMDSTPAKFDTSKAEALLGWRPRGSIDSWLRSTHAEQWRWDPEIRGSFAPAGKRWWASAETTAES